MTNELQTAYELGRAAFDKGINAPALDVQMMALIDSHGSRPAGSSVPTLKQWMKGWTVVMLAAPIK